MSLNNHNKRGRELSDDEDEDFQVIFDSTNSNSSKSNAAKERRTLYTFNNSSSTSQIQEDAPPQEGTPAWTLQSLQVMIARKERPTRTSEELMTTNILYKEWPWPRYCTNRMMQVFSLVFESGYMDIQDVIG